MIKEIAKTKNEWWVLVKRDLNRWNSNNHGDDNMGLNEWVGEFGGREIYGWKVSSNYGEMEINQVVGKLK